jgi:hypothetical protein
MMVLLGAIDVEWLTKWRQEGKTIHEICQLYNDKFHDSIRSALSIHKYYL